MDKQTIRERIWDTLAEEEIARFPFPPHGRIPNFVGAETAADHLAETEAWASADAIKANPDAPQRPVRKRALEAGKPVYMAVPRLRDPKPFLRLDPAAIDDIDHATTIGGSAELGEPVGPGEMAPIDLIVAGSVAVDERGGRIGKGEGYSDLEFAILREFELVDDDTCTTTTVHERQVVDEPVPTDHRDVPIEVIATPERIVRTPRTQKPAGLDWSTLGPERLEQIPILDRINPDRDGTAQD